MFVHTTSGCQRVTFASTAGTSVRDVNSESADEKVGQEEQEEQEEQVAQAVAAAAAEKASSVAATAAAAGAVAWEAEVAAAQSARDETKSRFDTYFVCAARLQLLPFLHAQNCGSPKAEASAGESTLPRQKAAPAAGMQLGGWQAGTSTPHGQSLLAVGRGRRAGL